MPARYTIFLIPVCLVVFMLSCVSTSVATTLQGAYELAGPANGYDKYLELETGRIYTGSLMIGPSLVPYTETLAGSPGRDVRIVGNGAIIDLQGGQICISYCDNSLDIDDCVVIDGTIRFRGLTRDSGDILPGGSVRHVTMYKPHDYGIRLQRAGEGITVERNLVVSAVDTGNDFIYSSGISMDWLPTGTNISAGWAVAPPEIIQNWSYHIDQEDNNEMLAHFSFL